MPKSKNDTAAKAKKPKKQDELKAEVIAAPAQTPSPQPEPEKKKKKKDKADKAAAQAAPAGEPSAKKKDKKKTKKEKNKLTSGELDKKAALKELSKLQVELVKLQEWVKHKGLKVVVLFEGRDAAGKGGAIKRITESLNPRVCRVVALGTPTEREKTQWYFQRYVSHLPAGGEMVLFDRSWYNRAGVERVMGFCTEEEYHEFLRSAPEFERMLIRSGVILVKYWFSVSPEEQERRFKSRMENPTKRWKLSPMDMQSRARWMDYSKAKDEMFSFTDTKQSPWYVVDSDNKSLAHLNVIRHLLSLIPYEDLERPMIELPVLQSAAGYERPPRDYQTYVPQVYK